VPLAEATSRLQRYDDSRVLTGNRQYRLEVDVPDGRATPCPVRVVLTRLGSTSDDAGEGTGAGAGAGGGGGDAGGEAPRMLLIGTSKGVDGPGTWYCPNTRAPALHTAPAAPSLWQRTALRSRLVSRAEYANLP
jgi:hypothetical protein